MYLHFTKKNWFLSIIKTEKDLKGSNKGVGKLKFFSFEISKRLCLANFKLNFCNEFWKASSKLSFSPKKFKLINQEIKSVHFINRDIMERNRRFWAAFLASLIGIQKLVKGIRTLVWIQHFFGIDSDKSLLAKFVPCVAMLDFQILQTKSNVPVLATYNPVGAELKIFRVIHTLKTKITVNPLNPTTECVIDFDQL